MPVVAEERKGGLSAASLIRRHVEDARQIFEPGGQGDEAAEPEPVTVSVREGAPTGPSSGQGGAQAAGAAAASGGVAKTSKEVEAAARARRRQAKRDKKAQDKSDKAERKAKRLTETPIIVAVDEDDIPNDQSELKTRAQQKRDRDNDK